MINFTTKATPSGTAPRVDFTPLDPMLEKIIRHITGKFEGGETLEQMYQNAAGSFDGMGVSAGILQWNLGSATLQPLLKIFVDRYGAAALDQYFLPLGFKMSDLAVIRRSGTQSADVSVSLGWQTKINGTWHLKPAWKTAWQKFMSSPGMVDIQNEQMNAIWQDVKTWIKEWGFDGKSLRAHALFMDIRTQNGSLRGVTPAQVKSFLSKPDFHKNALDYMKSQVLSRFLPGKEDYLGMTPLYLSPKILSGSKIKQLSALVGVNVHNSYLYFDCRTTPQVRDQVIQILGPGLSSGILKLYINTIRNANYSTWQPAKIKLTGEVAQLFAIAYLRSKTSNPLWQVDVFNRKATIALGIGRVHLGSFNFSGIFSG